MPDTSGYLARIRELAAAKDPLAAQAQAPVLLAELIATVSAERLTLRPAPDKWSIGEILAHLAEDVGAFREASRICPDLPSFTTPKTNCRGNPWLPDHVSQPERDCIHPPDRHKH
jgi:hypothetical protein